jgi:tetratricopeptide (TPR) repeat protein
MSAWLLVEEKQHARALEQVRAAEAALAPLNDGRKRSLLVLADLIGGVAEIRAGNVKDASARLASQKARYDSDDRVESNWVAALEGEMALAQGRYDEAVSSFRASHTKVWLTLGRDASTVFAINLPSRDGLARVAAARGNRAAAIEEYRRLTAANPGGSSSAVLEPRHVLELARLLEQAEDKAGARIEYERFLKLWDRADAALSELTDAKRGMAHSLR